MNSFKTNFLTKKTKGVSLTKTRNNENQRTDNDSKNKSQIKNEKKKVSKTLIDFGFVSDRLRSTIKYDPYLYLY